MLAATILGGSIAATDRIVWHQSNLISPQIGVNLRDRLGKKMYC